MSKYKLAAFDMDGTFLDSRKEIRPSTADACKRASAAGRILAIDTGRAVSELTLYPFGEMGIRYGMPHFQMAVYQPLYEATTSLVDDVRAFAIEHAHEINKMNMYHATPEGRLRTQERLAHLPLDFTYAEQTSFEVTPQGVSKGTGLVDLCEVLGLPIEEAIGVGDAFNDVPMLKMAGLGVAMGNSNEAALQAADVVVGDNDHDGIAEVIDRYLMG